jgi:site-specific recombinase XerD
VANGARKVAEFLWAEGIAIRNPEANLNASQELVLNAFAEHLDRAGQVAPGTRRNYLRNARDLLSAHFGFAEPEWLQLTAETVADFVRTKAARLSPSACRPPVTCTRAFLRFLVMRGSIRPGLEAAVPTLREWKHASLPRHVTTETVERVICCCDSGSPAGKRDRAVLLLLSRLGLRASEVAHLHLADIRWAEGCLLVRAGKTRRERTLPVPGDVGEAIAAYLQDARPATSARTVFVRATAPYRSLDPSAVSSIAERAFGRAGVAGGSAHTLRHTVATQMVRHGVSFKAIADLLGHASIATTAIYAKLDTEKLSAVALPWPGGRR